ncbi:hypothetical protein [Mycoplasma buteonis]|uniref:hypothetical protein n=1 Tax=Mycoplasma buteonis TaxID=171280 RepID=UPI00056B71DE|nr:hypothetical protein [Mycoplasma buteonis]
MKSYKRKLIIWIALTVFAIFGVIGLSVGISLIRSTIDLFKFISFASEITNAYRTVESYMIGGLAFCCLVTVLGTIITYSGIKSLKYTEMFY